MITALIVSIALNVLFVFGGLLLLKSVFFSPEKKEEARVRAALKDTVKTAKKNQKILREKNEKLSASGVDIDDILNRR